MLPCSNSSDSKLSRVTRVDELKCAFAVRHCSFLYHIHLITFWSLFFSWEMGHLSLSFLPVFLNKPDSVYFSIINIGKQVWNRQTERYLTLIWLFFYFFCYKLCCIFSSFGWIVKNTENTFLFVNVKCFIFSCINCSVMLIMMNSEIKELYRTKTTSLVTADYLIRVHSV